MFWFPPTAPASFCLYLLVNQSLWPSLHPLTVTVSPLAVSEGSWFYSRGSLDEHEFVMFVLPYLTRHLFPPTSVHVTHGYNHTMTYERTHSHTLCCWWADQCDMSHPNLLSVDSSSLLPPFRDQSIHLCIWSPTDSHIFPPTCISSFALSCRYSTTDHFLFPPLLCPFFQDCSLFLWTTFINNFCRDPVNNKIHMFRSYLQHSD